MPVQLIPLGPGVKPGAVVLELNGESMEGRNKATILQLARTLPRPLVVKLARSPFHHSLRI